MDIDLKVDRVYRIHHKRKGVFIAHLLEIVPADKGDLQDKILLKVRYDVGPGTDQIHLAVNPGKDKVRTSLLRPSLIFNMTELEEGTWRREVKAPEPDPKNAPRESIFKRMLSPKN